MICWIDPMGPIILVKLISNQGTIKSTLWMKMWKKQQWKPNYVSYEFLVMPFGLCNVPSMFTTFMNSIFHEKLDGFVIIYIDDILVYSKMMEEHAKHLEYEQTSW
jgi:hypothetical protein